ncbi:MAG: hypothetical protein LBK47_04195 [Prevotellaceae bacterium]|jgi:hypothetical protein|nr:hypothetical protein [Prevotellaceae bacterium]
MTRRNRKQYGLAFLIISLVGLALVILSGSVFSGYHFMDCHTYAEVQQELMQRSWLEILRDRVHGEFGSRFRPLFYVNVLFKTWLFGSNLALQGFWQLLQNIIAAFLIYALGRNLQFSHKESLLFAGLTLVGTQAAILYQTITVEPAGLIFLMLSWYFIVKYIRSEQHSTAGRICYTCGIVLSSLLAILIKENFILMLPASYVLWCMMYAQKQGANLKNTLLHTRKAGVFFLLLTVAALSAVVILASGGANFGYAGIDYHSGIGAYLKAATYFYTISGSAILAFMGTIYLAYSKKICNSSWIYALAFFAAITAPQIVVHAKSGIIDRYMIPGMVGCAYLAIFVYRELIKNDRTVNEKRWRNISLILGVTGIVVGGLAVFSQSVQQAIVAAAFYIQGQQLQEMTAASSIQYLTSTISTMGVAGMLTGGLLLAWGFRGFSKNADDTKNVCADDMKNVCVNDMKNVCADDMKKVCVCVQSSCQNKRQRKMQSRYRSFIFRDCCLCLS